MGLRSNARRRWWAWTAVLGLVCAIVAVVPQLSSADNPDPMPSPLYQQSLRTSIDRFDDMDASANGATTNRMSPERLRMAAVQSAGTGGSSSRVEVAQVALDLSEHPAEWWLGANRPEKAPYTGPANKPTGGEKIGGEDIPGAMPIPALPVTDFGSTTGRINDYDEACPYTGSLSPDVVYVYRPPVDEVIDIILCRSKYDTKVYVYENAYTPGAPYACNDDACGDDGFKSQILCLRVTGGNSYYIVVDGYGGANGEYELTVRNSDPVDCSCVWQGCSPLATPEGEPCVDGSIDNFNGGCNFIPNNFSPIADNVKVCGTVWYDGNTRDLDWYRKTLADGDSVTFCVTAEFMFIAVILDIHTGCPPIGGLQATGAPCDTVYLGYRVPAGSGGDYAFVVAPDFNSPVLACPVGPWEYEAVLNPRRIVEDCFNSDAEVRVSLDPFDQFCQFPQHYQMSGPSIVRRPSIFVPGPPETVPIELVQLSLTSVDPIRIQLNPDIPSQGVLQHDGMGNYPFSFFDVFVIVDLPMGQLMNRQPIHMQGPQFGTPPGLPPYGVSYQSSGPPIPLFPLVGPPQPAAWLCFVVHTPRDPCPTMPGQPTCPGTTTCPPQPSCAGELTCVGQVTCPGVITCPPGPSCGGGYTCVGNPSCQGSETCDGFYTCFNATCAAIQTCIPITCTAQPTCAGGGQTCSGDRTCQYYPTCSGTPTCRIQTCVGSSTCRGSQTCFGAVTCPPLPTYQGPLCGNPTFNNQNTCHGSSTCRGFYTCAQATCPGGASCGPAGCLYNATNTPFGTTCAPRLTCPGNPSCQGTNTCFGLALTCIGHPTCRGSRTCPGAPTCDQPPTMAGGVTCTPTQCTNVSCGNLICPPTIACDPSCSGAPCPTSPAAPSCGGGRCPTMFGAVSCPPNFNCATIGGPSCGGIAACPTQPGWFTCRRIICVPPTMPGMITCAPMNCPTIFAGGTCAGAPCPITMAPTPSCAGVQTCATVPCPQPTMPGSPTCPDAFTCPGTTTCFPQLTCEQSNTCSPMASCGGASCADQPSCPGNSTCPSTATCASGHTCAGMASCQGSPTCLAGQQTCNGSPTCDMFQTCGGRPTCNDTPTCDGTPSCMSNIQTCAAYGGTCEGAPTCENVPTCMSTETCFFKATCDGWPTCQAPASLTYDRVMLLSRDGLAYPPQFFDVFVTDEWHLGDVNSMLFLDPNEMPSPDMPYEDGFFDIFVGDLGAKDRSAVPAETVFVNTVLPNAHIIDRRDTNGDLLMSVCDFVLLEDTDGNSIWYHIEAIGTDAGGTVFFVELLQQIPPPPPCACDCHANPACDGVIDVLDVVATVADAFRGDPITPDPNPQCPKTPTDNNCDGVPTVLDVVNMVDVAFRNGDPALKFCNPCL